MAEPAADGDGAPPTNRLLKSLSAYRDFIAIIIVAISGLSFAVSYFVTQKRFAEEMTNSQCQLFANVAKLSQQITANQLAYMSDKTFSQTCKNHLKIFL
jgi:hypothetical protein